MKDLFFFLVLCLGSCLNAFGQTKIIVDPINVYQLAMEGDPTGLFDEQLKAGDPEKGKAGEPSSPFDHISRHNNSHARYIIDLGAVYSLSAMWIYDVNAKDTLFVYSGPFKELTSEGFIITDQYNAWQRLPLSGEGQFIMLEFNTMGAKVGEVVFYGKRIGEATNSSASNDIVPDSKTIGQILGVNSFNWCPEDLMQPFGHVREFREWRWNDNEKSQGKALAFSPAYKFDSDQFYGNMKAMGVEVVPCIQLSPEWLTGKEEGNSKPLREGKSSYLPESYREHSGFLYHFVGRYGSNAEGLVAAPLKEGQKRRVGIGSLKWIENWNEPDKRWKGRGAFFDPFEFAAMCSADYDGHNGQLGKGFGVKAADRNFKMAMGGLTQLDLNYLRTMKLWSDHMRSGFPADAINLHHYSNDAGGQHMNAKTGVSPEQDNLKEKLEEIVKWRNTNLPNKEVWLSEFGYATNSGSSQKAWYEGTELNTEEIQSQWLIRSVLEISAAGVDRAFIFNVYDSRTENTTAFGSCGLAKDPWGPNDCGTADGSCPHQHQPYEKKPSWYTMKGLINLMANFSFAEELDAGNSGVNAYKYSGSSDEIIYCIWSTLEKDFTLDISQLIDKEMIISAVKLNGKENLFDNFLPQVLRENSQTINGSILFITTK